MSDETEAGHVEGRKNRPCAIVSVVQQAEGKPPLVAVVPITHTPHRSPDAAIEIPQAVKRHLVSYTRSQSFGRNVPPNATVATLLALAIVLLGCSTPKRLIDAATGVIVVPVTFRNVRGDELQPNERPANVSAVFGAIAGGIFGPFHGPFEAEPIGEVAKISINLKDFRSTYEQQAATITDRAAADGWHIVPADTRFARVATTATYEGVVRGSQIRLVDSESKTMLLLVFFDRPCRLTGTVVYPRRAGEVATHVIDVSIDKPGLNWLEYIRHADDDHDVIRLASRPVHPVLIVEMASPQQTTNTDSSNPVTPAAAPYVNEGNDHLSHREYDLAIADFDRALQLDSQNAMAFGDRGMAYYWKGNYERARTDWEAAYQIDRRNSVVYRGRGLLARQAGDVEGAIAAFTTSLDIEPGNAFTLQRRAEAYLLINEQDKALADYAAAIQAQVSLFELYADRASVFRAQGRVDLSIREAEALITANPTDARAYIVAGAIDAASGKDDEAMRAFNQAIEISPDAPTYLTRAGYRHSTDPAGERADVDAALKLNARSTSASISLARLQSDVGDYVGALNTLDAAMKNQGGNYELIATRGIFYAQSGQATLAERDFAAARALATNAMLLNNICWLKAAAGVALDTALAECDASVAEARNSAAPYDSRGFVLLRLGRIGEAISNYDAALRLRPLSASSLYGRSLAEKRAGKSDAADIDLRAALRADAHIAEKFVAYGVAR